MGGEEGGSGGKGDFIYIYKERERERERVMTDLPVVWQKPTQNLK